MCSDIVVHAQNLGKSYQLYDRPADRLRQFLWRGRRQFYREFWALHDVNLKIVRGDVIGIVGRNGAGKSTILQMICGTLTPSHGEIQVRGRIAALLELGAGFNPEYTGRENVFMNASILGLSDRETTRRFDEIIDFAEISSFIDQPVKTYSSGMFMRLAFAIATSVDPDILVIDEALSVGDGAFARKSFDRIMALKDAGKTILFCSHSLYQIEAMCNRAIWLDGGRIMMTGSAAEVTSGYAAFLERSTNAPQSPLRDTGSAAPSMSGTSTIDVQLTSVKVSADGRPGQELSVITGMTDLGVECGFRSNPALPTPSFAVAILTMDGKFISSAGTANDGLLLSRSTNGTGSVRVSFPELPLLKGDYRVAVFLLSEDGVHLYDKAEHAAILHVRQRGLEQGLVTLKRRWGFSE